MANSMWALFSVANAYDQPDANLVAWWFNRPSFETLAKAMETDFKGDESILKVVKCHQGEKVRHAESDYRLENITEGIYPTK